MHARQTGPFVLIDEGHKNFHTKDGRYEPFAGLVEADGYRVDAHRGTFSAQSLSDAAVIVISNAGDIEEWALPIPPAIGEAEVQVLAEFVEAGGGLFLIADHMPFPGAVAPLAARFGIEFSNGFAFELDEQDQPADPSIFRRSEGRIGSHAITSGRNDSERVDQVATFTGSAFPVTGDAVSLIRFGQNTEMLLPTVAWAFDETTPRARISGWSQGLALEHGRGRVVIFGEAAMFTSQRSGNTPPAGMTSSEAVDNQQLLLNIIRWLSFDLQ